MTFNDGFEGRLFIDGKFTEGVSGRRYDVINPADESVVATAVDDGPLAEHHDARPSVATRRARRVGGGGGCGGGGPRVGRRVLQPAPG